MIITRIRLENYRSHHSIDLSLSKGINLILGKNGSGKSSILEAIAMVLFDINDRTGKGKGKQFIRYGAKTAKLMIDFIANDNRKYQITYVYDIKKALSCKLEDEFQVITSNLEELREKLNELCGIQTNYSKIYEHIIIAKQNEFVNIFKESPTERAKIFNKIFNTDSYSKMSEEMVAKLEIKYKHELEKLELKENLLNAHVEDEELLEKVYEEELKNLLELKSELESSEEKRKVILAKITDYETKEAESKRLFEKKKAFERDFASNKKALKDEVMEARRKKKAKAIVIKCQGDYEEHQKISSRLQNRKKEKEKLEVQLEKNRVLEQEKEKLTWEISQHERERQKLRLHLEELEKSLEETQKTWEEKQKIAIDLQNKDEILKELSKSLECLEQKQNRKEKELYSQLEKNNAYELERQEKEKKILVLSQENLSKKLEEFERLHQQESLYKRDYFSFEEKLKSLQEAQKDLEGRYCPLLQETCENIREKSVKEYFDTKIQEVKKKKEAIEKQLQGIVTELAEEKNYQKKQTEYFLLQKDFESLVFRIEQGRLEAQKIENEKISIQNEWKTILLNQSFTQKEDLQREWDFVKQTYASLGMDELRRKLEIERREKKEKSLEENELAKKIEEKKALLLSKQESIVLGVAGSLEVLKKELEDLESREIALNDSVKKYLANEFLANDLEKSLEKVRTLIKTLYQIREEKRKTELLERSVLENLENISLDLFLEEKKNLETRLLLSHRKLGELEEQHKSTQERLKKASKQKKEIEDLKKNIRILETKAYKAKEMRACLKQMGLEVSKYMLESISLKASANFNKITGRGEMIEWSNEEKDKYSVYLSGQEGRIPFENLSGGEQVSVAISLRETMTETFSNARFLILDEPTNNLDKEKKKLLAEHMGDMLAHLEQSIIVTHDDTFREMAERIIEL